MKKMGRPSKLTPEVQEILLEGIRQGLPLHRAARLAGINLDSYYEWLKKAESQTEGEYHNFSEALKRAEDEAQIKCLQRISQGEPGWQGSGWIMERRFREEWGQHLELRGNDAKPFRIQIEWPDDFHAPATSGSDEDSATPG